jgi:hypothetical protein
VLVFDAAGRGNLLMSEPDWLPDARELRGRQMGYQRIASRLGVSRHVVYYWLHRDRERARSQAKNPAQRARRRAARPARPARRVERVCEGCGERFVVPVSRTTNGRASRFCGYDCWKEHGLPALRTAPAKPSGWRVSAAFSLRLKNEDKCRACGGGADHLHHAIPRSMYRDGILELRNGIPLCEVCHTGWHHRRVTIYRDVFTEDEWAWLTTQELRGQNVIAWLDDRYPSRDYPRPDGECRA